MIPSWAYLALCVALLVIPPVIDCRRINRRRDNYRAIDAERAARENAAPLGNADRFFG
jgi:hypothetical protein